jgi:hypothetical protein
LIFDLKAAKIQASDEQIEKHSIVILNIDSILNKIMFGLRTMKVLNFASKKWVYMLKSVEKWLCNTRKYKKWGHLELLLNFKVLVCKKITVKTHNRPALDYSDHVCVNI